MQFQDIIGLGQIKEQLRQTLAQKRVAHAQLFLGAEGSGALALALAYAKYLQCEQPGEKEACGICSACRKMGKYVHPDLHFAFPVIGTGKMSSDYLKEWRAALAESPYLRLNDWLQRMGAENQQGNISKNECQDIIRKLSYTRSEGKYKILILWLPEFLGKEGNRLLKLIEEPQGDTIFLLVAEQAEKIINTIISRCQITKIPGPDEQALLSALLQKGVEQVQAQKICHWSEGNWNKALELLETTQVQDSALLIEWLRLCYKGKGYELVNWVEEQTAGKEKMGRKDLIFFFQQLLFFFREACLLCFGASPERIRLSPAELKAAQGIQGLLNIDKLQSIASFLNAQCYYVERNAHPKTLLLDTCIQVHKLLRDK